MGSCYSTVLELISCGSEGGIRAMFFPDYRGKRPDRRGKFPDPNQEGWFFPDPNLAGRAWAEPSPVRKTKQTIFFHFFCFVIKKQNIGRFFKTIVKRHIEANFNDSKWILELSYIPLFTYRDRIGFWRHLGRLKAEIESFQTAQKSSKSFTVW